MSVTADGSPEAVPKSAPVRVRETTRIPELDSLRGLGALAILAFHLWPATFFLGWSRVDLFFVMSGYLITTINLKYGGERGFLLKFYLRRILRTWPAYFAVVAVVCLIGLGNGRLPRVDALAYHLTFTQNTSYYWSGDPPRLDRLLLHTWCLAIEEQFYLLWPALMMAVGVRKLLPLSVWLIISSVMLRASGLHPWTLAARCDGLGLGAILAVALREGEWDRNRMRAMRITFASLSGVAAVGIIVLYSPIFSAVSTGQTFSQPLSPVESLMILFVSTFYTGLVALVVCHSGQRGLRVLRTKALCYIGRISYGIFLCHFVVIGLISEWYASTGQPARMGLGIFVLCILVGALSWEVLEKPLANLKRYLPYRSYELSIRPAHG